MNFFAGKWEQYAILLVGVVAFFIIDQFEESVVRTVVSVISLAGTLILFIVLRMNATKHSRNTAELDKYRQIKLANPQTPKYPDRKDLDEVELFGEFDWLDVVAIVGVSGIILGGVIGAASGIAGAVIALGSFAASIVITLVGIRRAKKS